MNTIFPGSFDPITVGHLEIIKKALAFSDKLYIVIENNINKKYMFSLDERLEMIKESVSTLEGNIIVDVHEGLTVDYCRSHNITHIVRGLRNVTDYLYEKDIATYNRKLAGVETLFLFAENENEHISSSGVRELIKYKADITGYVPDEIRSLINKKIK